MFLLAHFIHGFIHVFHDMKSVMDDFGSGIRHMRLGRREICLPHIHRDGLYGFQLAWREPAVIFLQAALLPIFGNMLDRASHKIADDGHVGVSFAECFLVHSEIMNRTGLLA